jgi:DNA-binding transcriptional ArsR family regulator
MTAGPDEPKKRKGRKSKKSSKKKDKPKAKTGKGRTRKRSDESHVAFGEQRANRIKAIDHPLRRRILRILTEEDKPLSPNEVRRRLNLPLGAVSYQTRVLRKLGAVKLAASRQVRGAVERFHVSMIADDQPIVTLLAETRAFDEGHAADEAGPSS